MNDYKLPDANKARYRSSGYSAQIIRDPINLTPAQELLGQGLLYYVRNYGCQANVRDGETMAGILEAMGYKAAQDIDEADIVILNTCAVRENAENKVLGEIGLLQSYKRRKPDMIIGISGCIPQEQDMARKIVEKYPSVELMLGTHNIYRLPEMIEKIMKNHVRSIATTTA